MNAEKPEVFVIDDDASVLSSMKRLLYSLGFSVRAFSSAEEFLKLHDNFKVKSCLIIDVHMPGIGGLELQDILLEQEKIYPIIFITAHIDDQPRLKAMKNGAVAYLYKPLDEKELIESLCMAIGVRDENCF